MKSSFLRVYLISLLLASVIDAQCSYIFIHCICSWLLYMLGMLGVGPLCLHFSWNVPSQSSCESWSSGTHFHKWASLKKKEKEKKKVDTCVNLFSQDIQYVLYANGSMKYEPYFIGHLPRCIVLYLYLKFTNF